MSTASRVLGADRQAGLREFFRTVRGFTERLQAPLSAEDCLGQSMPNCSPVKWHLAHTSWFFETFVLEPNLKGYRAYHPQFKVLFNSYYKSVGEQFPRPMRGMLTRPGLDEVLEYRRHVDLAMEALFAGNISSDLLNVIELGCHHEQQHQELLLTDIKNLFSLNPTHPEYVPGKSSASQGTPLDWIGFEGGVNSIGMEGEGFCFDNELPRHRVFLEPYEIASRPVNCGEYLAFINDGGYERPEFWLSDGWDAVQRLGWEAPLYWTREYSGDWKIFTLSGLRDVCDAEPVCHVSYYEAEAYSHWAGARLVTEAEWEHSAAGIAVKGHLATEGIYHPVPGKTRGLSQMVGDVWEWTQSAYLPYPGYKAQTGALGEYNGKFMCNQMVLRGGSCATPENHIRTSYRNFFQPDARWQFSGIRLARSV